MISIVYKINTMELKKNTSTRVWTEKNTYLCIIENGNFAHI